MSFSLTGQKYNIQDLFQAQKDDIFDIEIKNEIEVVSWNIMGLKMEYRAPIYNQGAHSITCPFELKRISNPLYSIKKRLKSLSEYFTYEYGLSYKDSKRVALHILCHARAKTTGRMNRISIVERLQETKTCSI